MGNECPIARRRRQSGPGFNAKRRAYRARDRLAHKLARTLEISLNEAKQLAQVSQHGKPHVSTSVHPERR